MSSIEYAFKSKIPIDLTSVSPDSATSSSLFRGIVTIKWPYSSSSQKITFLLADPDPRKRASGGQVKITLFGEAAEILDQTESGEEISVSSSDSLSIYPEPAGQRAKWHIEFPNGCILQVCYLSRGIVNEQIKDNPPRTLAAAVPPAPLVIPPLPRIPTPTSPATLSTSSSSKPIWKTPLKRKFSELTDHSMTTLTDEEEWFGSEPRLSNEQRRFSGRMRFIDPTSSTPSTPIHPKKVEQDENSFFQEKKRDPDAVLRAQNLVSAEILKDKLVHPPRRLGTDDMSHMAVMEESRPTTVVGEMSRPTERSFEVFRDRDELEVSQENILPPELTRKEPSVGVESFPARGAVVQEKSPSREEAREEVEILPEEEPVLPQLQITEEDAEPRSSHSVSLESEQEEREGVEEYEEEEDEEVEGGEDEEEVEEELSDGEYTYDASGQLVPTSERRYYTAANASDSDDRLSEIEGVDYGYPEQFADDEELSGEDYDEEEDSRHAGYYSRDRRGRREEEEIYHSDEEDYSSEEEEEERGTSQATSQQRTPVMVDLTLDSDEEEVGEEEGEDEEVSELGEEEAMEGDEEEHEGPWLATEEVSPESQTAPYETHFRYLLDPTLMAPLPHPTEQTPALQPTPLYHLEMFAQAVQQSAEEAVLDPALVVVGAQEQVMSEVLVPTLRQESEAPVIVPPELLSMDMDSNITQPQLTQQTQVVSQDIVTFTRQPLEVVDSAAGQEFLTGVLPMASIDHAAGEALNELERSMSEFLPNIMPATEVDSELKAKAEPVVAVKNDETSTATAQATQKSLSSSIVVKEKSQQIIVQDEVTATVVEKEIIKIQEEQQTAAEEPEPQPSEPRELSPPPIPDTWHVEGLETPLAYYYPLTTISPPSLRAQKEHRDIVDFIGIVREVGELAKTKGPDYVLPLYLVDPTTGPDSGLSVLVFRPHKSALPVKAAKGAVMIFTDMKVQSYKHRPQTRTTETSGWILFPPKGPVQDSGPPVEYGEEEKLMVRQLKHWWKRVQEKGKGKGKENGSASNGSQSHQNEMNGV